MSEPDAVGWHVPNEQGPGAAETVIGRPLDAPVTWARRQPQAAWAGGGAGAEPRWHAVSARSDVAVCGRKIRADSERNPEPGRVPCTVCATRLARVQPRRR